MRSSLTVNNNNNNNTFWVYNGKSIKMKFGLRSTSVTKIPCFFINMKQDMSWIYLKFIQKRQSLRTIKWVVIETTGVCDITSVTWCYIFCNTLIKFAIHRSIFPKRSGRSHWRPYRHQWRRKPTVPTVLNVWWCLQSLVTNITHQWDRCFMMSLVLFNTEQVL